MGQSSSSTVAKAHQPPSAAAAAAATATSPMKQQQDLEAETEMSHDKVVECAQHFNLQHLCRTPDLKAQVAHQLDKKQILEFLLEPSVSAGPADAKEQQQPKPAEPDPLTPHSSRTVSQSVDQDLTELRRIFASIDTNNDGSLSRAEILHALKGMGVHYSDEEEQRIMRIFEESDVNHDDAINWNEFEDFVRRMLTHVRRAEASLHVVLSMERRQVEAASPAPSPLAAAGGGGGLQLPLDDTPPAALDSPGLSDQLQVPALSTASSLLSARLCDLVEQCVPDLAFLAGTSRQETELALAVVVRVVQSLLDWGDVSQYGRKDAPGALRRIAEANFAWKNREGAKEQSFEDLMTWFETQEREYGEEEEEHKHDSTTRLQGIVSHLQPPDPEEEEEEEHAIGCAQRAQRLLLAMCRKHTPALDALSQLWGARFNTSLLQMVVFALRWRADTVSLEELEQLEDPAIFAFSFGTGTKLGPAQEMPTLVGPGMETPGAMNEALAEQVRRILAVRPMPVFAQWEIADALLYGPQGCSVAQGKSFAHWKFAVKPPTGQAGGSSSCGRHELYPLVDSYRVPGTEACVAVHKALPVWPLALRKKLCSFDRLADARVIKRFYLSSGGVLEQFDNFFDAEHCKAEARERAPAPGHEEVYVAKKPRTVVVVAHTDHRMRCQMTVLRIRLQALNPLLDSSELEQKTGQEAQLSLPIPGVTLRTKVPLGIPRCTLPADTTYPQAERWRELGCDTRGYDPHSTQKWTTNRPLFVCHEATARAFVWARGDFGPLPVDQGGGSGGGFEEDSKELEEAAKNLGRIHKLFAGLHCSYRDPV